MFSAVDRTAFRCKFILVPVLVWLCVSFFRDGGRTLQKVLFRVQLWNKALTLYCLALCVVSSLLVGKELKDTYRDDLGRRGY